MFELEKVLEDKRGWITRIAFKDPRGANREAIIIFTRKGFYRGGEHHKSLQHDLLLTGSIRWLYDDGLRRWEELHSTPGTSHEIKAGVLHLALALEDTLYIEWLDGYFEKTYDPEMRKLVEAQL